MDDVDVEVHVDFISDCVFPRMKTMFGKRGVFLGWTFERHSMLFMFLFPDFLGWCPLASLSGGGSRLAKVCCAHECLHVCCPQPSSPRAARIFSLIATPAS